MFWDWWLSDIRVVKSSVVLILLTNVLRARLRPWVVLLSLGKQVTPFAVRRPSTKLARCNLPLISMSLNHETVAAKRSII